MQRFWTPLLKLTAALLPVIVTLTVMLLALLLVIVTLTVMLISLPLKPPVKLRSGDESSLCLGVKTVVVRKQNHSGGISVVHGE